MGPQIKSQLAIGKGERINNQRARLETMRSLELAEVPDEEPICRAVFPFVKLTSSKNSDPNKFWRPP